MESLPNAVGSAKEDRDILCGIGKFKPKWLQVFNNATAMCIFITIYAFTHGFISNGVFNINTSSFERRFQLSSYQVGWVNGANDISAATLGTLISFYGAGRYKARWLSMGIAVTAVGCLLMGLPHYLTGPYEWGQNDERICRKDGSGCSDDDVVDPELSNYLWFLMAGHFLNGVSGSTLMTVGMSYIDDSIPSDSSPLYTGIVHSMLYVGAGVGFVLGGAALNLYVDFDSVPRDQWGLTPNDPRWVGAWWLSFFLATGVYFILCLIFLLYGSELPSARKIREEHEREYKELTEATHVPENHKSYQETNFNEENNEMAPVSSDISTYGSCDNGAFEGDDKYDPNETKDDNNSVMRREREMDQKQLSTKENELNTPIDRQTKRVDFKDFFPTLFLLFKSPTFVFLCLAYSCSFMVITSYAVFMAKTVQFQYNQTAPMAAMMAGLILLPGAGIGQFLGGFIIKKMGLQVKGSLVVAIITKGASVPLTLMFLFYCEKMDIAGWNVPYDGLSSLGETTFYSDCNRNCSCNLELYDPVCDNNNKQYFSPCFAGCLHVVSSSEQIYSNCSCLVPGNDTSTVSPDFCLYGCNKLYIVLAILFICLTLMSCIFIPIQTVILRIHSDLDKTFSLGIMWLFARVLGAIPGPIILGAAIDATCIVWGHGCKEGISSCWIYDNQLLGRNVCIFSTVVNFGATVMLLIAYLCHRSVVMKRQWKMDKRSDMAVLKGDHRAKD